MSERTGLITFQGNPLTLSGNEIKVGDVAPDFTALKSDLSPVSLSSFRGKTVIISAVPSLDTPVCDAETRRFNEEAAKLGNDVVLITISMDLPFAQSRWCTVNGIENIVSLSDHKDAEFGNSYGMLIKELRLLARAVFIINPEGKVQYIQLVKEVASEPDYDAVINAI